MLCSPKVNDVWELRHVRVRIKEVRSSGVVLYAIIGHEAVSWAALHEFRDYGRKIERDGSESRASANLG